MKKKQILIVDDGKLNRVSFKAILKDDYDILEAENGKEALDILNANEHTIALIILDLVMPVMDGYQFLEIFHANARYRYTPVIVSTTNDDAENESRCLALGAWDFIPKTFHKEIIRFRVRNAIEKSRVRLLEYDYLTGIYCEQKFYQETREVLDNSGDEKFAFVQFNIKRFKMINNFYGSKEGNRLICYVANAICDVMQNYSRQSTFGRINNDVFAICMPYTETSDIEKVLAQIKKQISKHSTHYYLDTCAGIYLIEDKSMAVVDIFSKASMAAAVCKDNYMLNEAMYTEELSIQLKLEQQIIDDMDDALENHEFVVYFQPKYELEGMSPRGAEALVRWRKPDGTMVSPGVFIPTFEKNGFITKLDYYVWEKVCQFINTELTEGRKPTPISVNVSRVNLYNPNFLQNIIDLVERYKIEPKYFHLELTESVFSDSATIIQDTVVYLHKLGFTIMMDDFGSGYSSLNVLKDVDLDVLKIDMKFFSKGGTKERRTKIVEAVVRMAKSLNMTVIAEGVEEKEQVDFLTELGCDYIQGYYFAKPMPQDEYKNLINPQKRAFSVS